ncbi:MAG: hypothetical protein J6O56_01290 [Bacilli bacterium]|nr:hypothetical protein [Bacilli bacterium]
MDKLEYELVTLRNNKQYFVLEDLLYKYDTYDLVLNVEDENDIKIVLQEVKNGKTVLTDVEDKVLLSELSPLFEERIRIKQKSNI